VYNAVQVNENERGSSAKDALLARFLGNALEHDQEDVEYWRNASDEQRGRTLYRLLLEGRRISAAVPNTIAQYEDSVRLILNQDNTFAIITYE